MFILRILAFIFLIPGFATVLGSRWIVNRFGLVEKTKCNFEHTMDEDELKEYCLNKAIVNVKMLGMLIALPGIILIAIAFR